MLATTRLSLILGGVLGVSVIAALTAYAGIGAVYGALATWAGSASPGSACSWARWHLRRRLESRRQHELHVVPDGAIHSRRVSNLARIVPALEGESRRHALSLLAPAGIAAAVRWSTPRWKALAQAIYTMAGLVPLVLLVQPTATRWLSAIAVAIAPIFAIFAVTRRRGALLAAEQIIVRIARALGFAAAGESLGLTRNVLDIYQKHRHVWLALLLHLAGWFMSAVQLWAAAQALDRPLSAGEALALQSIAFAARGAIFFVPAGFGVQEGTFVLVGAALGVEPAIAVALSLVLRARDILLGLPALMVWYTAEGRHRLRAARVPTRSQ